MALEGLSALLIIGLCLLLIIVALGSLVLLAKLGIIAYYWGRPNPHGRGRGHTLTQSRAVDASAAGEGAEGQIGDERAP